MNRKVLGYLTVVHMDVSPAKVETPNRPPHEVPPSRGGLQTLAGPGARTRTAILWLLLAAAVCDADWAAGGELAFQQIYAFPTAAPGAWNPATRLVEGGDGNFYGTTTRGGVNDLGTVFKVTPDGLFTTLLSFNGPNGQSPYGGLVLGGDGNFYGTTSGGTLSNIFGTVFRMSPGGTLTTLCSFQNTNGSSPDGPLQQGGDGNFYGLTSSGGSFGLGTAFAVSSNGVLTTLTSFAGTNGCNPHSGLVAGSNGTFYGVTQYGGSNFSGAFTGNGTAFTITTNGLLTTLVYFNLTNGSQPMFPPVRGRDGNFYGTASQGGAYASGNIYRLTTGGLLTTLVSFGPTGGVRPFAGLAQGSDGDFYGTTAYAATASGLTNGTLFKVTTSGVLTTLVNLDGTNGLNPSTDLVLASDGNLYGAMADITLNRSVNGGTLFRLAQRPLITTITSAKGSTTVSWSSFPNGAYQVERTASLNVPSWSARFPAVTATGSACAFSEPLAGAGECYYRVALLP